MEMCTPKRIGAVHTANGKTGRGTGNEIDGENGANSEGQEISRNFAQTGNTLKS